MTGPQLGANVDEQPAEPDRVLSFPVSTEYARQPFTYDDALTLAGTDRGRVEASIDQMLTREAQRDDAVTAAYTRAVDQLIEQGQSAGPALAQLGSAADLPSALAQLDRDERVELDQLRELYRVGEFVTPLPDGIDPNGRARWHSPDGRVGPGWLVMREPDGGVYVDPGAPLFGPYPRDYALALALAVMAACGPAPTSTEGDVR